MPVAIDQLWLLLVESGLLTSEEAHEQAAAFGRLKGAETRGSSSALAQWLIARGLLTRYQAKKLVSGHHTNFVFGDYVIQERIKEGPRSGLLRAIHRPTRQEVFLYFRDRATPPGSRRLAADTQRAVTAEGEARVIQAATLGSYQWHEEGKSRFFVLEAIDDGTPPWRIFMAWLSPSAGPQVTITTGVPPAPGASQAASSIGTAVLIAPGSPQSSQQLVQPAAAAMSISALRQPRRTGPPLVWIAAAAGALVAVLGVGILFWAGGGSESAPDSETPATAPTTHTATDGATSSPATDVGKTATVKDGTATKAARAETIQPIDAPLWQSPTAGRPLDLTYLPSGVQMVIALRPAELLAHPEAARLLDARTLGPLADWFTTGLPSWVGQPAANIEQALVGLLDGGAGPPRVAIVARLRGSVPENELVKAWGGPAVKSVPLTLPSPTRGEGDSKVTQPSPARGEGDSKVAPPSVTAGERALKLYERDGRSWYLPRRDGPTIVVVGPSEEINQVAAGGDAPPALQRELEALLAASDDQRHVTILFAPRFLFTGGKTMFSGPAARLTGPLDWFFSGHDSGRAATEGKPEMPATATSAAKAPAAAEVDASGLDLAKGAMLSLHLTDDLFAELRLFADQNRPPAVVAGEFRRRVAEVPKRVDRYIRSLALTPYSYDVLWQYPRMIDQLERFTTAGFDGKQTVLRVYLPAVAAHNLALGTHLALLENPRDAQAVGGGSKPAGQVAAAGQATAAGQTAADRLRRKISLVFASGTLDKALQSLGEEIGLPVVILGADLQLEGITKNQSFALAERDQPAVEILRKIMLRANPDGKLVYVVKLKEGGTEETLYITTRAAAAKRGDTLPPDLKQ